MNLVTALLTNGAYGYPKGAARRRKATILACLHQTANTATAMQERNYANRAHSTGPSATAYIDRDGSIVRAILPGKYAAWCAGRRGPPRPHDPDGQGRGRVGREHERVGLREPGGLRPRR